MTAAEKQAHDIWMKLFQKQIEITGNGDGNLCTELALIMIDEIMESNADWAYSSNFWADNKSYADCEKHWQEVKKALNENA